MLEARVAANLKFFPGNPKVLLEGYVNAYEECHRLLENKRAEALELTRQIKITPTDEHAEKRLATCQASIALLEQRLLNYTPTSRVKQVFEVTNQSNPEEINQTSKISLNL